MLYLCCIAFCSNLIYRQEQERRRQLEFEKQLQRQREQEQQREEERRRAQEQREAARRWVHCLTHIRKLTEMFLSYIGNKE